MPDEGRWGKQREKGGFKLKFKKTGEEASWKRKKHVLWGHTCLQILGSYLSFSNISISVMKVATIYISGKSNVPAHISFFACNVKRDFLKEKQNKNKNTLKCSRNTSETEKSIQFSPKTLTSMQWRGHMTYTQATLIKGNIEPCLIGSFASSEWGKVVRGKEKLHLIS